MVVRDQPVVVRKRPALANLYRELGLYDAAMPLQEAPLATVAACWGGAPTH